MAKKYCKHCGNEFEGYKTSKYCSETCAFKSKEYLFDEETECWNWKFSKNTKGYGVFWFNNKNISAHRFSCESANGPAPEGKNHVLHSCDNPGCVNPAHLRWGSPQENMDDKIDRNRANNARGEKQGKSKLQETKVIEIKEKLKSYVRGDYSKLADEYNVHKNTIKAIHYGKNWKHI